MASNVFRYEFAETIPAEDIEASLLLAILGCEALHGETQVRLEGSHYFDRHRHWCVIDAGTTVGANFNRLFLGFLRREFGDETFRVERVENRIELASQEPSPSARTATNVACE